MAFAFAFAFACCFTAGGACVNLPVDGIYFTYEVLYHTRYHTEQQLFVKGSVILQATA